VTTRDERPSLGNGDLDLSAIGDRVDFAATLTALRERAGKTVRDVSRECGVPAATLGGYFSGRHLPPTAQIEQFQRLLKVLGIPEKEFEEWREVLARVRRGLAPQPGRSPYRGLEGYGVADAGVFVGREALVADVCARLQRTDGPTLVALVGVSGTGKSSLLRAGVLASLQREGWELALLSPGLTPDAALAPVVAAAGQASDRPLVVAVDQLEEIFSPEIDATRRGRFLENLMALTARSGPRQVSVVVAVRADFYAEVISHPVLADRLAACQVLVGPMTPDELRRVIVEPAKRAGRSVEPALADLILRDLGDRDKAGTVGSLPLLAHALVATWSRIGKGALRAGDYVAAGGLAGAVQRTAEEVFGRLSPEAQQDARTLFAQLVHVDEDGLAIRRRIGHDDIPRGEHMTLAVERFVAGRILTATEETVEIGHDVLLDAWPRLRAWIEEDRDRLALRRRVSAAARAWEQDGEGAEGLLHGPLLELARGLPDSGVELTAAERAYVAQSEQAYAARQSRARRRRQLVTALAVVATVLAVVASTLAVHLGAAVRRADQERSEADQARREALSRNVALEATTTAATDPALAAQLAVAAYRAAPTLEARSAVLAVTGDPLVTRLVGAPGVTQAVASGDGTVVAAAGAGGMVRIYTRAGSAAPRAVARTRVADGKDLFAAAFSPSHPTLAVGGVAGDVTLLDLSDPARPTVEAVLHGATSAVQHVAFSPDGTTVFAAASDSALYRWRLDGSTATPLPVTRRFGGAVQAVAASARGLVATGGADGEVRLWRAHGDRLRLVRELAVGPATDVVKSVAFSPDGRMLAAGATDEQVRVWRLAGSAGPRPITTLGGFASWVNAVAFSPDGTALAAGASGALAQVWRTTDWHLTATVPGPVNFTSVAFVPGTDLLLTGGIDGVARLRPLDGPRLTDFGDLIGAAAQSADGSQIWVAPGSENPVVAQVRRTGALRYRETGLVLRAPAAAGTIDQVVAASPDGSEVVAGTGAGKLVVWRIKNGRAALLGMTTASTTLIEQVAFSPDGRFFGSVADDGTISIYPGGTGAMPTRVAKLDGGGMDLQLAFGPGDLLAVASAAGVVHLWHLSGRTWTPLPDLKGFASYVYGVAFSPDGHTFAAGGADKLVRIYRVGADDRFTATDTVAGPGNTVHWLDFGDGGRLLAAASQDGKVWLWKVAGAKASTYAAIGNLGGQAYTVHLGPAAHEVFATGASGLMDGWSTDVATAVRSICATSGSPLSRVEWSQYVPGARYAPPCA